MLAKRIEQAGLRAWPAFREEWLGGWLLRFANGYTKRANSATLLDGSTVDTEYNVEVCEARFRAAGLSPVFRLLSFTTPPQLDALLEAKGYLRLDPSLVLHRFLGGTSAGFGEVVASVELAEWLPLFCRLHGTELSDHSVHKSILQFISTPTLFATVSADNEAVACGLGVLDGNCFGLFDLVTASDRRNQGLGFQLVSGMLDWAREQGATQAYLQVMEHNAPARRLYQKLGFRELYHYWYRSAPPRKL